MDCFFVKDIPDIPNKQLLKGFYEYFGYVKVDIFRPTGNRRYNMGCCKLFLKRTVSIDFDIFKQCVFIN